MEVETDVTYTPFIECCDQHAEATGKQRWTLALAKVPQDPHMDGSMRTLMGDVARRMARASVPYVHYYEENYVEHAEAIS
jgi:hypothetical protein